MKWSLSTLSRSIAAAMVLCCTGALAQGGAASYPAHPIKIVVPYSAGTSADNIARRAAEQLSKSLGQTVYVENRPGAGGVIGADYVAKAAPDGYTLMVGSTTHVISPALRKAPYDPVKDFAPIGEVAESAQVIVTAPSVPANNFKELVAYLKSKGDDASYSSPAVASTAHLYTTVLQNMVGSKMRHIPSSGMNTAIMDVVQGSVTLIIAPVENAKPLIATGKLKAIAQTGRERSTLLPDVPTLGELGYPNYQLAVWVGLYAPAGTPPAVINRLNKDLNAAFGTSEAKARLAESGYDVQLGTPAELGELTAKEYARWSEVVKTSNIAPE